MNAKLRIEIIRRREAEKGQRTIVTGLLTQKLVANYGRSRPGARSLIAKVVDQFVKSEGLLEMPRHEQLQNLEEKLKKDLDLLDVKKSSKIEAQPKAGDNRPPSLEVACSQPTKLPRLPFSPLISLTSGQPSNSPTKRRSRESSSLESVSISSPPQRTMREYGSHRPNQQLRFEQPTTEAVKEATQKLASDWSLLAAASILEYEDEEKRKRESVIARRKQLQEEHDAEVLRKKEMIAKKLDEEKEAIRTAAAESAKYFADEDEKQRRLVERRKQEAEKQKLLAQERRAASRKAKAKEVESGLKERKRLQREQEEAKKVAAERRMREQGRQDQVLQDGIIRKRAMSAAKLKEFRADEAMNAAIELEHRAKEDAEKAEWYRRQEYATGMASWFMQYGGVDVYHPRETEEELMARVRNQRARLEAAEDARAADRARAHEKLQARLAAENEALMAHRQAERARLKSEQSKERAPLERAAARVAQAERMKKAEAVAREKACKAEVMKQIVASKAARRDDMTTADRSLNKGRLAAFKQLGERDPARVAAVLGRFPQAGRNVVPAQVHGDEV